MTPRDVEELVKSGTVASVSWIDGNGCHGSFQRPSSNGEVKRIDISEGCAKILNAAVKEYFLPSEYADELKKEQDATLKEQLHRDLVTVDEKKLRSTLPTCISSNGILVRLLVTEIESTNHLPYRGLLSLTVRPREKRNQYCQCEYGEYCACVRSYYLKSPTEDGILKKIKSKDRTAYNQLVRYVQGPPDGAPLVDNIHDLKDKEAYFYFHRELRKVQKKTEEVIHRINAVSLVTFPSYWVEQILLSKTNTLSAPLVLKNSQRALDFLNEPSYLDKIVDEVKNLQKCFTNQQIYDQLRPLLSVLAHKRNLPPPLRKKERLSSPAKVSPNRARVSRSPKTTSLSPKRSAPSNSGARSPKRAVRRAIVNKC